MISIVLADDHKQVRDIWNFILSTNSNFKVLAKCCNGEEAIEAAGTFSPDVFLMDINMKPMNGITATETITRLYPHIKVVGMSIHTESVYVTKMFQSGASAYVTKNSPYEEVFEAITQVHAGNNYLCSEVRNSVPELAYETVKQ